MDSTRIVWIHGKIVSGKYPNSKLLSEEFGISRRQAQREFDFLRDEIKAPIIYFPQKRGYTYSESFGLPLSYYAEYEKSIVRAIYDKNIHTDYEKRLINSKELYKAVSSSCENNDYARHCVEIEFLEKRPENFPLDNFLLTRNDDNSINTYVFCNPEIFLSVLLTCNIKFRIIEPAWVRDYLKILISNAKDL